jgi:hypothetical protein
MFKPVLIFVLFSVAIADRTYGNASFNDDGELGISTKGNWMSLKWATLSEVDSTGAAVQTLDLSKHHYGWSEPEEESPVLDNDGRDTGDRLPGVNVSVQLENGALFNVTAWILNDNVNNSRGKRGDVKFSIFIGNWTFVGPQNGGGEGQGTHLVLTAGLAGFGGMVRSTQNKAKNGNTTTDLEFGAGYLNSPTDALYDGVSDSVSVTNSEHGKPVVTWTFRRFDHNVSYDPIFGNSGATIVPSALLSIFVMALALFKLL